MTTQIAVRLDDDLADRVRAEASEAGENLSEWIRTALAHRAASARAMRARAEEDARDPLRTEEQDAALSAERRRRAIASLDER